MVKVLGLGDNVCDVYLHTGTMYPGGQAVNFAVYARMLGAESDLYSVGYLLLLMLTGKRYSSGSRAGIFRCSRSRTQSLPHL